jgi:hypothetical protein
MGIEISVHCAELFSDIKVSLELHIAPPPLAPLSMMTFFTVELSAIGAESMMISNADFVRNAT